VAIVIVTSSLLVNPPLRALAVAKRAMDFPWVTAPGRCQGARLLPRSDKYYGLVTLHRLGLPPAASPWDFLICSNTGSRGMAHLAVRSGVAHTPRHELVRVRRLLSGALGAPRLLPEPCRAGGFGRVGPACALSLPSRLALLLGRLLAVSFAWASACRRVSCRRVTSFRRPALALALCRLLGLAPDLVLALGVGAADVTCVVEPLGRRRSRRV
jgi:hypothetical protein